MVIARQMPMRIFFCEQNTQGGSTITTVLSTVHALMQKPPRFSSKSSTTKVFNTLQKILGRNFYFLCSTLIYRFITF